MNHVWVMPILVTHCGACKELVEHVFFECASYDSQRWHFLDYLKKQIFPLIHSKLFSRIFDKIVFCLGEKLGKLVNDECSSRYNRAGNFLVSV